jgi:acetyl esterase/lipase
LFLFLLCLTLLTGGPIYPGDHAAAPSPPGRYLEEVFPQVSVTRNLTYREGTASTGEPTSLLLDLYEPAGDTAPMRPAIVWIHGGGFYKGAKTDAPMSALADRFARRGYVTVSTNYRLAARDTVDPSLPTFSKPALSQAVANATQDARAALRWLRANAAKYRVDKQRIAIGGGSAGAFTSLQVAYGKGDGEGGGPGSLPEVRAVVDFWGGLLDPNEMKAGGPPLIVIHGTQDKMVPFTFAEKLVARAKEVGVICEFHPLEGEGHAAWVPMDRHIRCVSQFLYHHLIETP